MIGLRITAGLMVNGWIIALSSIVPKQAVDVTRAPPGRSLVSREAAAAAWFLLALMASASSDMLLAYLPKVAAITAGLCRVIFAEVLPSMPPA